MEDRPFTQRFLDLLETSSLMTGVLTMMVVGTWLWLVASARPVPDDLHTVVQLVVAFFFGAKIQAAQSHLVRMGRDIVIAAKAEKDKQAGA